MKWYATCKSFGKIYELVLVQIVRFRSDVFVIAWFVVRFVKFICSPVMVGLTWRDCPAA